MKRLKWVLALLLGALLGTPLIAPLVAQIGGAGVFNSVYYESGTVTLSFETACTTTPTVPVKWVRVGDSVTLSFGNGTGFPCTADSTQFLATTQWPAALRPGTPTRRSGFNSGFTDNGVGVAGCVGFQSDGTVFFSIMSGAACNLSSWTASGSRNQSVGLSFSYTLP